MAPPLGNRKSPISNDIGGKAFFYERYQEQVGQDETRPDPQSLKTKEVQQEPLR